MCLPRPHCLPVALALALAGLTGSSAPALAQDAVPAPSIAISAPTPSAALGAGVTTQLTAAVSGAFRVVSVHVDGGPPVCVFLQVHDAYACPWTPQASDIGTHTILARVETADGQVATATEPVTVGRLLPAAVGAHTTRRHLRDGGWRLTTRGTITVPPGLTATACSGSATVTVLAAVRTLVDRTVTVAGDCRFSSTVTFAAPRHARSLRVKVAFGGATLLAPRSAPPQIIRLR